jgi:hypothetical protein
MHPKGKQTVRVAILIISAPGNMGRWGEEKQIWKSQMDRFPSNVHAYFLEGDDNLSRYDYTIIDNCIKCGVSESFIPGILLKTIIGLRALPDYDFYVRTNLSTVINVKSLLEFITCFDHDAFINTGFHADRRLDGFYLCDEHRKAKETFIQEAYNAQLPYHGSMDVDNLWCGGWAMLWSQKVANLLINYMSKVRLDKYDVPDDVLLGIIIGHHDRDLRHKCQIHDHDHDGSDIDPCAVFHRCKNISKKTHAKFAKQISTYHALENDSIVCNDAWFNKLADEKDIIVKETQLLVKEDLPKTQPFILVTANNLDYPSGRAVDILELPNLVMWYGTFPCANHSKFKPLPLGPKMSWTSNGEDTTNQMNAIKDSISKRKYDIGSEKRNIFVYCNFNTSTTHNPHIQEHKNTRDKLKKYMQDIGLWKEQNVASFEAYMQDLSNSVFCLSPPGNGVDSHRTWESLLMGCIPIVLHYKPLLPLYENLPVYVVNSWDEITESNLKKKQKEFAARNDYSENKLFLEYYIDQIKNVMKSNIH